MLSTPGPGYPHHHSCLCPCLHVCCLLCGCPRRGIGHPHCLSLARDKPGAEEFVGTPQLDYPFSSKQCLALATPHQHHSQPCSFSFIQDYCHQKEKKQRKDKPRTDFPHCPPGLSLPHAQSWAARGHGGGCLRKKPQRCPSGVAQPCQARSILPLNMKLPLSPNPLPRGWVSPHFSSLTLMKQHGGLQGSTCFYLCPSSLCPLLPPLSFPSFSSGYFSRAGMLVLLLLPSSCDLNIKHLRKISPRAPSPGSIPGPRQPP